MSKPPFDCSPELKTQFNRHFEVWKKRHQEGLDELARRCGVSASYLSHIGRYGRIPGRPILILLALNFELDNPQSLFDVSHMKEPFPYEPASRIGRPQQEQNGFLSVKLDMNGFTDAIRSIVHQEARPRDIHDLTRGKPLRMGLNRYQDVILTDMAQPGKKGFFLELCDMLAMTLRCKIETFEVPYPDYPDKMRNHEIDLYGPKNVRPGSNLGFVSVPFCRMGIAALIRKRPAPTLERFPAPMSQAELLKHPYQIAVLRNSRAHLFANIALRRADSELVLCDTMEVAVERTTLAGISRPVHLTICNAPNAIAQKELHGKDIELAFGTPDTVLELSDDCIAVRSDWPELVSMLNQSIAYLIRTGAMQERFNRWLPSNMRGIIQIPEIA